MADGRVIGVVVLAALAVACRAAPAEPPGSGRSAAGVAPPFGATASRPTATTTAIRRPSPAPSATASTASPSPMPSTPARRAPPSPEPAPSCAPPPPDDRGRVEVAGETITVRTRAMLEAAQARYGGPGDLLRIVQGSYSDAVAGSFGTHDGGGAVDISIRDPRQPAVRLFDDVEAMVAALRWAGFAAWYRGPDEVFAGSVPHIHAIAVGDPELSPAALDQLVGPAGYFRGFDGLPHDPPRPDRHGGPVVCGWMAALGYRDLRQ